MARPKRDPNIKPARIRIIEAFWNLLANNPYHDITIQSLSIEAGVNHNTFYYHFQDIDDLAKAAFLENLDSEASHRLLDNLFSVSPDPEALLQSKELLLRGSRARLFTRGDSTYLVNIFKSAVSSAWLEAIGLTYDDLTPEDKMDLEFIFSGLTTIIGQTIDNPEALQPPELFRRELGVGILATLNRLKTRKF